MLKQQLPGFTLIELMAAVAIIGILMTGGIVYFSTFAANQQNRSTALELQSFLRRAQNAAQVRSTPQGCGRLIAHDLVATVVDGNSRLEIKAYCTNASGTILPYISGPSFSPKKTGTTFIATIGGTPTDVYTIRFLPQFGGVQVKAGPALATPSVSGFSNPTSTSISLSAAGSSTFTVSVSRSGAIGDPVKQ